MKNIFVIRGIRYWPLSMSTSNYHFIVNIHSKLYNILSKIQKFVSVFLKNFVYLVFNIYIYIYIYIYIF
jgi:hypothetical protein